jgi:uncharacterized protein (DUF433 family)
MAKEYVSHPRGGYVIKGTRVSLDSVVCAFLRGESPEGIVESFPALTLEQVYGALSYYLAHREAVDEYLSEGKEEFDRLREESRHKNLRCTPGSPKHGRKLSALAHDAALSGGR